MIHEISVLGCGVIYIDNERVFGSKPYGLFSTVNWSATDEDLKRIADRCLEVISDRKTENHSGEAAEMVEPQKLNCRNKEYYSSCEYVNKCHPIVCFKAFDELKEGLKKESPTERDE